MQFVASDGRVAQRHRQLEAAHAASRREPARCHEPAYWVRRCRRPVDVTADAAPPPPSCDLPDAGAGCGWLCGDGVSATICDVTGKVYTRESILAEEGVGPATLLELGGEGVISFRKPAVASDGSLIGYVAVNAAPGVYSSGEAIGCSDFSVSYYLPVPASVDCGDASGPSCPAGCTSACSGFGCLPCTPNPPGILYAAQTVDPLCNGPSNESPTDGGERAGIGSWTATLTAVDPAGTSAGATAYGTLRAELVGEGPDGGAIGSATLLLVF